MDANEYRFKMLEDKIESHKAEISEIRERQMKNEMSMNEFHLLLDRLSIKLDHIQISIESGRKNTKEWVRWVPGVLFGSVAMVIAIIGKVA